jgi:hypothetical protein
MHYPSLTELADRIRAADTAVRAAMANALAKALDAGDDLIEAKKRAPAGGWIRWIKNNCGDMPRSTAKLYMRLAKHRTEIEKEREKSPNLSLQAARRLITKPKSEQPNESEQPDDSNESDAPAAAEILIETWNQASDADRTAFLEKIDIDDFIKVMPDEFRIALDARVRGNIRAKLPPKMRGKFKLQVVPPVHH